MCEGMTMAAFDVDRGLRGSRNRVVAMGSNTMILVDASVLHVMILSRYPADPSGYWLSTPASPSGQPTIRRKLTEYTVHMENARAQHSGEQVQCEHRKWLWSQVPWFSLQ